MQRDAPRSASRAAAIFAVATAGFLLSMFYRVSVTVVSNELAADLGLGAAGLAALSAAFFYAFAAAQPVLGPGLDRLGPRLIMAGLGLTAAGGSLLFALADSAQGAFLGRALMGLGMSGNLMGALTLLVNWFPADRFATLMGVLTSVGSLGMALAATPLALLSRSVGWRGAFVALAAANLLQVALLLAVVRNHPAGAEARPAGAENPFRGLGRLLRRPWFWIMSGGTFFRFGAFMALTGLWAGPYLRQGLGLDQVAAGNALLACSIGYILSLPVSGRLSDRTLRTRKWVVIPSLLAFALLLAVLPLLDGRVPFWALAAIFFMLGATAGPGQVTYAHIKELAPPGMAATAMSAANLFNMLGPAALLQVGAILIPGELVALDSPERFTPVWLFFAAGVGLFGLLHALVPESPAMARQRGQAENP
ncbi:MAG: MFS transporter [Thermodesulfobacteriota bacterium]